MLLLLGVMCCPSWLYCTGRFLSLDQRSKIYRISSLFPFTLALLQIYTFTQYLSYSLIIYLIKKKTFRISFELSSFEMQRMSVWSLYILYHSCMFQICFCLWRFSTSTMTRLIANAGKPKLRSISHCCRWNREAAFSVYTF